MRRAVFVACGAAAQLVLWLVVRPDRAGPQWTDGTAVELWLALEALAAVLIGVLARDRTTAIVTVAVGWLLQVLHFGAFGEHSDGTLWGIGLLLQVLLAAGAAGLALLARLLAGGDRRRVGA